MNGELDVDILLSLAPLPPLVSHRTQHKESGCICILGISVSNAETFGGAK